MTDAEKEALAIYELICATSADRPFAFHSMHAMHTQLDQWKAANPALVRLVAGDNEVRLAFLAQSYEWLLAEAREHRNFRVTSTLSEAIHFVLLAVPKPLPTTLVHRLLSDFVRDHSAARMYFPLLPLLASLTSDQITDDIRTSLRKFYLQLAPTPTGKIDDAAVKMRALLAPLIRMEGEKELDTGRGPWSQIVFDELAGMEAIARAGWEAQLDHFRALEQTTPGTKWNKRSHELLAALGGRDAVMPTLLRWLALGPTPGQPAEARSPAEDSPYQKGLVWFLP